MSGGAEGDVTLAATSTTADVARAPVTTTADAARAAVTIIAGAARAAVTTTATTTAATTTSTAATSAHNNRAAGVGGSRRRGGGGGGVGAGYRCPARALLLCTLTCPPAVRSVRLGRSGGGGRQPYSGLGVVAGAGEVGWRARW